jgi:prophage maintenance system killer protein
MRIDVMDVVKEGIEWLTKNTTSFELKIDTMDQIEKCWERSTNLNREETRFSEMLAHFYSNLLFNHYLINGNKRLATYVILNCCEDDQDHKKLLRALAKE